MNNIAVSFASLVKNNNGMFKSEAQAKFLLSQCHEEMTFVCGGSVYNNSFTLFYSCDNLGVVKVEKYLPKTGRNITAWERKTEEQYEASLVAKALSKKLNDEREAVAQAKWQNRENAFQAALATAKSCIKGAMIGAGKTQESAERCVNLVLKNSDDIQGLLEDLTQYPEFVEAWDSYNKA